MPERVPFRMTQNISRALGFTGVEVQLYSVRPLAVDRHHRYCVYGTVYHVLFEPIVDVVKRWRVCV